MNDERCDLLCLDAPRAEAIRVGLPGIEAAGEAAEWVSMLSDPTRLVLAAALGEGEELCVCDSSGAQNLASHHLRLRRSHRLVTSQRSGKLIMYSLTDEERLLRGRHRQRGPRELLYCAGHHWRELRRRLLPINMSSVDPNQGR
jgi:ArsR family transcriptional regulator, lead/cadmium/zinc/bismuth-responsive transcriptional repressor